MELTLSDEIKFSEQLFDARFHPCSETNLIAAVSLEGNVHLIESGKVESKIKKHHRGSPIRKVRFLNDGRMVTIAKTVKVYDLTSSQTVETLRRDDDRKTTFYSLAPLGNNLVSAGDDDGAIFVWDLRSPSHCVFTSHDCDQYISDIDGKLDARKLMVCVSGEGTLTAYDLRSKKMIEPQSELFEAGFQCVKLIDSNKKVVVGGEDGAVYVFNQNEWAHTSGKFALSSDQHNRGKCTIDCIDVIPESSIFMAGCSDGKLRTFKLWPHEILKETSWCRKSPLESVHIKSSDDGSKIVISGENYLNIVKYEHNSSQSENDSDDEKSESVRDTGSDSRSEASNDSHSSEKTPKKKFKCDDNDYLHLFD